MNSDIFIGSVYFYNFLGKVLSGDSWVLIFHTIDGYGAPKERQQKIFTVFICNMRNYLFVNFYRSMNMDIFTNISQFCLELPIFIFLELPTYEKVLEESLQFRFLEKKTDYLSFIY